MAVVALAGSLAGEPGTKAPQAPVTRERIAFSCEIARPRKGEWAKTAIFTMNADGSGVVQVTSAVGHDEYPTWAPDGSRIAFQSDRGGKPTLYVMNADGSELRPLLRDPGSDCGPNNPCRPRWSPDGSQIAFSSRRGGDTFRIYRVQPDGAGLAAVTDPNTRFLGDTEPAWSPDGREIAFHRSVVSGSSPVTGGVEVVTVGQRRDPAPAVGRKAAGLVAVGAPARLRVQEPLGRGSPRGQPGRHG